jgi:hypothetical protein
MKKFIKFVFLIFTLHSSLFTLHVFASTEFGGSRAWGMGQAFTAYTGDPGCVYHNPAGLAVIETPELDLNIGSFYSAGSMGSSNGMIFTWPWTHMDYRKLTVHCNNYSISNQLIQQAGISYSRIDDIKKYKIRWGTTMKWRSDTLNKVSGYMFDAGIQSDFVQGKVSGGFRLLNFLSGDTNLAEPSPSWGILYNSPYGKILGDFTWHVDRYYLNAGWENELYRGLVVARLGLLTTGDSYLTTGISSYLWPIGFDVSFSFPINSTQGSGYFQIGLRYKFGGQSFSEMYLDRSIDKAVSLEYHIEELNAKKKKLAEEILLWEAYKTNPTVDMMSLPGIAEELLKKPLPKKEEKKEVKEVVRKEAPKPIVWPQSHRVIPGDTLRSLAQRYYNDPNKWQQIYNANPGKIERGQPRLAEELTIPKVEQ